MNQEELVVETPVAPEVQEAATPSKKTFVQKLKSVKKPVWIAIALVVVALIGGLIAWSILSNTYETPLKLKVAEWNSRKIPQTLAGDRRQLNGLAEKEIKEIYDIIGKCDDAEMWLENLQDNYERQNEEKEEQYGEDYKLSYVIEDKEKLEKSDLRKMKTLLREATDWMDELIEGTEDWDSDDWEEAADEVGLTKSQMKSFVKALEKLKNIAKKAEISEGYELCVTYRINGSELDEPEEVERTYNVYKINGRWVDGYYIEALLYSLRVSPVIDGLE